MLSRILLVATTAVALLPLPSLSIWRASSELYDELSNHHCGPLRYSRWDESKQRRKAGARQSSV